MSAPDEPYLDFAKSVTPPWRHKEFEKPRGQFRRSISAPISVVDISSTGDFHAVQVALTESELRPGQEYQSRLASERQALRTEDGDIAIRLVIFSMDLRFVCDLYGVEFQIEPSFFVARQNGVFDRSFCFLEEEPPSFVELGDRWCVKVIDGAYDHPLIRKGVTMSKAT